MFRFARPFTGMVASSLFVAACAPHATLSTSKSGSDDPGARPATSPPVAATATTPLAEPEKPADSPAAPPPAVADAPAESPHSRLIAWFKAGLLPGDEVVDGGESGSVEIVHTVGRGEIPAIAAHAYLAYADTYFEDDFTDEIAKSARKQGGYRSGNKIHLPHLVTEAPKTAAAERLPYADGDAVRGLYIRGGTTTKRMFPFILDQMAKRDINAVVLDAKDYDGPVTYASKVPLAVESGAAKGAPIHDLSRLIRFVHKKGIHVVMRVSCFNDEFMSKAHPELAVQSKWGKPYPNGWLDPNNKGAQDYILALVQETIDSGADEVELDYVRYPVLGIKGADFHLDETQTPKTQVIRDFVRRAHAITQAAHVPLSLDLFGVVAQGRRIDIDALGQDMSVLAPECEAFSPMVYPSHYSKGFYGWDNPGDHPEIVGIGVKGSLEQIKSAPQGGPLAVVRPWIQAEDYKTTNYSPQYLKDEIRTGNDAGGHGWLMWNPSQEYGYAWAAVPVKTTAVAAAADTPKRSAGTN